MLVSSIPNLHPHLHRNRHRNRHPRLGLGARLADRLAE